MGGMQGKTRAGSLCRWSVVGRRGGRGHSRVSRAAREPALRLAGLLTAVVALAGLAWTSSSASALEISRSIDRLPGGGRRCEFGYRWAAGTCQAVTVPPNARLSYRGDGWICDRGFRRSGAACVEVAVPANARLNYSGDDWRCDWGYQAVPGGCVAIAVPPHGTLNHRGDGWTCELGYRRKGAGCESIAVPPHANLNGSGDDWRCQRGYRRAGEGCVAVAVPANATLNDQGDDWKCVWGYQRTVNGCEPVVVPANAHVSFGGNDWECDRGFLRVDAGCRAMTEEEMRVYAAQVRALRERRNRSRRGSWSLRCGQARSERLGVCASVVDGDLLCREDNEQTRYVGCSAEVSYELYAETPTTRELQADLQCTVQVFYWRRGYRSRQELTAEAPAATVVPAGLEPRAKVAIDMDFSADDDVIKVEVAELACRVENVRAD